MTAAGHDVCVRAVTGRSAARHSGRRTQTSPGHQTPTSRGHVSKMSTRTDSCVQIKVHTSNGLAQMASQKDTGHYEPFCQADRTSSSDKCHRIERWKFRRRSAVSSARMHNVASTCRLLGQSLYGIVVGAGRTDGSRVVEWTSLSLQLWICFGLFILPVISTDPYEEPRQAGEYR